MSERAEAFAEALSMARLGGKAAMQALAEDHLPLVGAMVARFPHHGREKEELYQQGCVGLMKALARFDPGYGVAFSTYAASMILGEMRMLCRMDAPLHVPRTDRERRSRIRRARSALEAHLGREPTVDELAALLRMEPAELVLMMEEVQVTSLDAPLPSGRPLWELLPDADDWMTRLCLRDLMQRLSAQDQRLMLHRYRMGATQAETARALGISQVQVSRRESAIRQQLLAAWQDAAKA